MHALRTRIWTRCSTTPMLWAAMCSSCTAPMYLKYRVLLKYWSTSKITSIWKQYYPYCNLSRVTYYKRTLHAMMQQDTRSAVRLKLLPLGMQGSSLEAPARHTTQLQIPRSYGAVSCLYSAYLAFIKEKQHFEGCMWIWYINCPETTMAIKNHRLRQWTNVFHISIMWLWDTVRF